MSLRKRSWRIALVAFVLFACRLPAQDFPGYEQLLNAADEPENWLMYGAEYNSHRYSRLTQITPENVDQLNLAWAYQSPLAGAWQTTPIVEDGVMYLTQRPNDVVALDAATGRLYWIYSYKNSADLAVCCGSNNRGLAILGDTLYMGTLDAHLVAIDKRSGEPLWKTEVAESGSGYSLTHAPLVAKDKVIVGVGGGEYGIRGFIAAYHPETGEEVWKFYTIPGPGEPGHETWGPCPPDSEIYCDPEAWKHGGGSIWVTGSYDPELNLTYWGTGNAGPDHNGDQRPGDNLYTTSVVALDNDTGELRWHFQFTPHDVYDYDAVQVPVLADITWEGAPLKAMLWANRNGYFYVFDREIGKFLLGKPFVKVNWASGLDENGRPIQTPQPLGRPTYPSAQGATNWYSPSYSPRTGLLYVTSWQNHGQVFWNVPAVYQEGRTFGGGTKTPFVPSADDPDRAIPGAPTVPDIWRGPINDWTDVAGYGSVLALDPVTGEPQWGYRTTGVSDTGIVTTATDLLFTGLREGNFHALDARSGEVLWQTNLGAPMPGNPITYAVNGRQYVAATAGIALYVFALPE